MRRRAVLYSVIAVLLVTIGALSYLYGGNYYGKTSVYDGFAKILQNSLPENPDLYIQNVTLKKTASPNDEMGYFKYDATVIVNNQKGEVLNATTTLDVEDQKHQFLKNTEKGLSLGQGESYIVKNAANAPVVVRIGSR